MGLVKAKEINCTSWVGTTFQTRTIERYLELVRVLLQEVTRLRARVGKQADQTKNTERRVEELRLALHKHQRWTVCSSILQKSCSRRSWKLRPRRSYTTPRLRWHNQIEQLGSQPSPEIRRYGGRNGLAIPRDGGPARRGQSRDP